MTQALLLDYDPSFQEFMSGRLSSTGYRSNWQPMCSNTSRFWGGRSVCAEFWEVLAPGFSLINYDHHRSRPLATRHRAVKNCIEGLDTDKGRGVESRLACLVCASDNPSFFHRSSPVRQTGLDLFSGPFNPENSEPSISQIQTFSSTFYSELPRVAPQTPEHAVY